MTLFREIRLIARSLGRSPQYTTAAIVATALGIGAAASVFSVVDGVLLRPLGYHEPDRLTLLWSRHPAHGDQVPPSYLDFRDWRDARPASIETMVFVRGWGILVRGTEGVEPLTTGFVSEGFFSLTGAKPLLGRAFTADEERGVGPRVVVLSYGAWRTRFGADPSVVGRPLSAPEAVYTVVGVMPPSFTLFSWAAAWSPLAPALSSEAALGKRDLRVDNRIIARLSNGATIARASAELDPIAARLELEHPAEDAKWRITVRSLRQDLLGQIEPALIMLSGAVALVLLIACANVGNLALVRASTRAQELAVRIALGAGARGIARLLLLEGVLICLAGGAVGTALAWGAVKLVKHQAPAYLPRVDEIALDGRVVLVAAALSLLTAAAVALPALWHATHGGVATTLREGTRGAGHGRAARRLRAGFVVAELALSLMLLAGAGLLVNSFLRVSRVDPGFAPERTIAMRVEPNAERYDSAEKLLAFYDRLRTDAAALPGVAEATIVNHFPLSRGGVLTQIRLPDRADAPADSLTSAIYRLTSANYFSTIGARIVRGRALTDADMTPTSTSLVINETAARAFFGTADPIGRRVSYFRQLSSRADYGTAIDASVVGVVHDMHEFGLSQDAFATVYAPMAVNPWRAAVVAVRVNRGDPATLGPALRRLARQLDPDVPASEIFTGSELLSRSFEDRRFHTLLLGIFATAALALAAIGVYGVISYAVAQRTREVGIRAALGATPGALRRMFVIDGVRLVALGSILGLLGAIAASRVLAGLLFGVSATDPLTLGIVALTLGGIALFASWLPARRAARVDPITAMRAQ